ncbi:hypothetical protein Echvi_1570 [Echinicola vietnamensis DSM 17526]|uniref:Uncharacterized protein n=1 Tax=Echinicola vietnamensis (strain DSM 17526 / LMG 23754 / KMM 6221) TaxID=926556 RepID=L0FYW6_ECHVK|nr:hypothetical protein Echvi_1570 [Echinicola vietnamensis DSM 17526]
MVYFTYLSPDQTVPYSPLGLLQYQMLNSMVQDECFGGQTYIGN